MPTQSDAARAAEVAGTACNRNDAEDVPAHRWRPHRPAGWAHCPHDYRIQIEIPHTPARSMPLPPSSFSDKSLTAWPSRPSPSSSCSGSRTSSTPIRVPPPSLPSLEPLLEQLGLQEEKLLPTGLVAGPRFNRRLLLSGVPLPRRTRQKTLPLVGRATAQLTTSPAEAPQLLFVSDRRSGPSTVPPDTPGCDCCKATRNRCTSEVKASMKS